MRAPTLITFMAVLALLAGVKPGAAEITYPWCAQYGGWDGGGRNCGFSTYEQCRATVSGVGGYCEENPMYRAPGQNHSTPRRQRR